MDSASDRETVEDTEKLLQPDSSHDFDASVGNGRETEAAGYESLLGKKKEISLDKSSVEKSLSKSTKLSGKAWGRVWCKFCQLPYPVFFIIWNEFCERFSYYGMRAVLVLFLTSFLSFGDNSATAIYHAFIVLCYMLPLVGAIISDSWLGKYGTIVSLSILYSIGNVLMAVSAIPFSSDNRTFNKIIMAVALFVIAFGTGGIKPCVSAFGGDQFTAKNVLLLPVFFSIFYFSINAGSLISTLLTPVLRGYVSCFGEDECFPLAFGVPAILMVVSVGIFLSGSKWYVKSKPKKEAALLFLKVPYSVVYAIYRRIKFGQIANTRNFMDYATPRFSEQFVYDVWLFLRVLTMFLPLPIFWALFDQQGSRWTLQALRLNGRFGKFVILPDQVMSLNPIFIIVLIPIFETVVYPLLAKCHVFKKPLQRMGAGMAIAGLAFVFAGFLDLYIQSQSGLLNKDQARLVVTNTLNQPASFHFQNEHFNLTDFNADPQSITTDILGNHSLNVTVGDNEASFPLIIESKHILQLFLSESSSGELMLEKNDTHQWVVHGDEASVRVFVGNLGVFSIANFSLCSSGDCSKHIFADITINSISEPQNVSLQSYTYKLETDNDTLGEVTGDLPELRSAGIYTIVITSDENGISTHLSPANSPNSVSIFLQVPMYFIITVGEVLFSITGLEFAYSQAPVSMKSLCSAAWLLTVAFGNLVVVIVAESTIFSNQAYEFFFFAAAIEACCLIFVIMTCFYKYVDPSTLLVSHSTDNSDNKLTESETSKLVSSDQNQLDDYEDGKKSPSPRETDAPPPQYTDYESEF